MTKTLASGVAAFAFALTAGLAYAQDTQMPTETEMEDAVMDAAEDTMEAAEDTMEAAEDLQDDTVEDAMDDDVMDMDETREPVMIMSGSETSDMVIETDCPEGTTDQGDGTCMVTGEWDAPEE